MFGLTTYKTRVIKPITAIMWPRYFHLFHQSQAIQRIDIEYVAITHVSRIASHGSRIDCIKLMLIEHGARSG